MVRMCRKGTETLEPTLEAETQWVNSLEVQDRGFLRTAHLATTTTKDTRQPTGTSSVQHATQKDP